MARYRRKMNAKVQPKQPITRIPSQNSLLQDFVQNTSLLGVQHFLRNKSFVWLIAYLICVAMSIVQSWSVTLIFFEQKTFREITITSKTPMPFPSVTVCTHTNLKKDFNFSLIPGFNVEAHTRILEECTDEAIMRKMRKVIFKNSYAALLYIRSLSDERRYELGLNLTEVIEMCKFGSHQCNVSDPNEIYTFSDPIYGNCFTFNPAFDDSKAKYAHTEVELTFMLIFPSLGYWLEKNKRASLGVHIHPPGTAPLIESSDTEIVFADSTEFFALELESEMINLKKRTATIPSCVDIDDETYRRRSIHYSAKSPYKYSQEACFKSCKQEAFAKCDVVYGFAPVQSKEYERGKEVAFFVDDCNLKPITIEACNCPIPCRKTQYRIRRVEKRITNVACEENPMRLNSATSQPPEHAEDHRDYNKEAVIRVKFTSNIYQRIEEHLCYEVSEFLGILGGNISLWIGLCIISLLEVVELGIKMIVATVRPQREQLKPRVTQFLV